MHPDGWLYRITGSPGEEPRGYFSDQEILREVTEGRLQQGALVWHAQHTKGDWVSAARVKAFQQRFAAGQSYLVAKAAADRQAKVDRALRLQADKAAAERLLREREEERAHAQKVELPAPPASPPPASPMVAQYAHRRRLAVGFLAAIAFFCILAWGLWSLQRWLDRKQQIADSVAAGGDPAATEPVGDLSDGGEVGLIRKSIDKFPAIFDLPFGELKVTRAMKSAFSDGLIIDCDAKVNGGSLLSGFVIPSRYAPGPEPTLRDQDGVNYEFWRDRDAAETLIPLTNFWPNLHEDRSHSEASFSCYFSPPPPDASRLTFRFPCFYMVDRAEKRGEWNPHDELELEVSFPASLIDDQSYKSDPLRPGQLPLRVKIGQAQMDINNCYVSYPEEYFQLTGFVVCRNPKAPIDFTPWDKSDGTLPYIVDSRGKSHRMIKRVRERETHRFGAPDTRASTVYYELLFPPLGEGVNRVTLHIPTDAFRFSFGGGPVAEEWIEVDIPLKGTEWEPGKRK